MEKDVLKYESFADAYRRATLEATLSGWTITGGSSGKNTGLFRWLLSGYVPGSRRMYLNYRFWHFECKDDKAITVYHNGAVTFRDGKTFF